MKKPSNRTGQAREVQLAHSQPWVQCPRPNADAGLRLVCVPYSGGRASVFNDLAAELPGDVELWAIELPGHGRRLGEAPLTRLQPLVDQLTDVLADVPQPYVLLGYSVGALISFEVARNLPRLGWPGPSALFVAAARAPHLRSSRPPLHELSRDDLVEGLHRLAGHRNALLDNKELVDVMLPVLRADLGLDETYDHRGGDPVGCPIAAFGGSEDWSVTRSDLEGWREHTTSDFSVCTLPGGHFFLDSSRGLFAEALTAEIERLKQSSEEGLAT
ncbi:thioesterase II family protein [Micromonospora sp. BQ11]|uniref:thioesterase II family protein n=1 Tax=Micromonospora sp. BQ11 TaxID=3452212 RepID=UPI003F8C2729